MCRDVLYLLLFSMEFFSLSGEEEKNFTKIKEGWRASTHKNKHETRATLNSFPSFSQKLISFTIIFHFVIKRSPSFFNHHLQEEIDVGARGTYWGKWC